MSDKIKQAKLLAMFVHANQQRQDGESYINHCQRVVNHMMKIFTGDEHDYNFRIDELTLTQKNIICAAWLHDTIEDADCPESISGAIRNFFGDDVWNLVMVLTHDQLESYNKYIEKVSRNPGALQIKWVDMIDNCSYSIPQKQFLKYREACMLLQQQGFDIPSILKERLRL